MVEDVDLGSKYFLHKNQHYSVTSFSAASLSADLGLVRLGVSSEKTHLVRI